MSFLKTVNTAVQKSYSLDIIPSEYRGLNGNGDAKHFWPDTTFEEGKLFSYHDCLDAVKAFQRCPPLAAIVLKMARAYTNGKTWIMDKNGKEAVGGDAEKLRKLLAKPNPLQSWKSFEAQQEVYLDIFGWFALLPIVPLGFEKYGPIEATSMWNIAPNILTVKETGKLFYQTDMKGIIDSVKLNYRGNNTDLKIENMYLFKDIVPSFETMVFPDSRIRSLEMPINNVIGAYESRNVLINYRGALGAFTLDKGGGQYIPILGEKDKEDLQNQFMRYGLKKQQWKFIISKAAVKWQQIGIPTRELMLFEEIEDDIMRICDAYEYPSPLINSVKGPSVSNTKQYKAQLYQDAIIPRAESNYEQWNLLFRLEEKSLKMEKDYSKVAVLQEDVKLENDANNSRADYTLKLWKNDMITRNRLLYLNGEDTIGPAGDIFYSQYAREQEALNPQPQPTTSAADKGLKKKFSLKENPYHDEQGRFTTAEEDAGGGGGGSSSGGFGTSGGLGIIGSGAGVGSSLPSSSGNIKTAEEARSKIQEAFDMNGVRYNTIEIGNKLSSALYDDYVTHLSSIVSEYNMPPEDIDTIQFESTNEVNGQVKYSEGFIQTVNLGHIASAEYRNGGELAMVDAERAHVSTLTHEMGHVITGSNKRTNEANEDFWSDMEDLNMEYHEEIKKKPAYKISKYAHTNIREFVAEGFTEYRLRKTPGKYATKVGKLIDKYFRK